MQLFASTLVTVCLLSLVPAMADEHEVPGDFDTIQQAIDAAQPGNTILVHPGTWFENIDFLDKDLHVRSVSGSGVTIIDGNGTGTVVTIAGGQTRLSILESFTIQNGFAAFPEIGAGVFIQGGSPTIVDNVVRDNDGFRGGGLAASGGAPWIEGNEFHSNQAYIDWGGGLRLEANSAAVVIGNHVHDNDNSGISVENCDVSELVDNLVEGNSSGGIASVFSSTLIRGNHIRDNRRSSQGGGISLRGAARAQVIDNLIEQNHAGSLGGGGIGCNAAGTPTIRHNVFRENDAPQGGAISMDNFSDVMIEDNLFVGNTAFTGGAIEMHVPAAASGPLIRRNTFVNNAASQGSALFAEGYDGDTIFTHNVIAADPGQTAIWCDPTFDPDSPQFYYNDVWVPNGALWGGSCSDQTGIGGNISADPRFVDVLLGDYRLQVSSACVDAGDPSEQPAGLDLYGSSRLLDGDLDGFMALDMGTYEASNVYLNVVGEARPGADVAISTSGTGGMHTLIVLGYASDGAILSPFGTLFIDLQRPFRVLAVGRLPLETNWQVPLDPSGSLAIQACVRSQQIMGGNVSNPFIIPLD